MYTPVNGDLNTAETSCCLNVKICHNVTLSCSLFLQQKAFFPEILFTELQIVFFKDLYVDVLGIFTVVYFSIQYLEMESFEL